MSSHCNSPQWLDQAGVPRVEADGSCGRHPCFDYLQDTGVGGTIIPLYPWHPRTRPVGCR